MPGEGCFSAYHAAFWDWVWGVEAGVRPHPFVAIWPRGSGKSTNAEIACAVLGARQRRHYILYVSGTQEQANEHVQNIQAILESAKIEAYYPDLGERAISKFGIIRGWNQSRLRTRSGFTVDALGLDASIRGARVESHRPDLVILDDIDALTDNPEMTQKKIDTITKSIFGSGSVDMGVLAVQNLIHPESIFSRLAGVAKQRADFLADRIVSGPFAAIEGLTYVLRDGRAIITGGTPTWAGQDLLVCQQWLDQDGLTAFLTERQQALEVITGGMFDDVVFRHCERAALPDLVSVQVWVDPAVTETNQSDSHGIAAAGIDAAGHVYLLYAWERRTSPEDSLRRALLIAHALGADTIGIETDQGGDTWLSVMRESHRSLLEMGLLPATWPVPRLRSERAGTLGSKIHRASQLLAVYERGAITHAVGVSPLLEQLLIDYDPANLAPTRDAYLVAERGLRRFPRTRPYDCVDAVFWAVHALTRGAEFSVAVANQHGLPEVLTPAQFLAHQPALRAMAGAEPETAGAGGFVAVANQGGPAGGPTSVAQILAQWLGGRTR